MVLQKCTKQFFLLVGVFKPTNTNVPLKSISEIYVGQGERKRSTLISLYASTSTTNITFIDSSYVLFFTVAGART